MRIFQVVLHIFYLGISFGFTNINTSKHHRITRQALIKSPISSASSYLVLESQNSRQNFNDENFSDMDIVRMERDVMKSTRAKLDERTVERVLTEPIYSTDSKMEGSNDDGIKVPVAAGTIASIGAYSVFHSFTLAAISFMIIFIYACGDPMQQDSFMGALSRVVGRQTLTSFEASKPKVKSVLRATIQGDEELYNLREQVNALEQENTELRLWIEQRNFVDRNQASYNMNDLKRKARQVGLKVPSTVTKPRLMMKLLEKGVITMR